MNIQINQKDYSLLSCLTKSILLGSLLGDGSLKIHKGYKNARFSFRHSIKQKPYFLWKRNSIQKDLSGKQDMWEQLPSSFSKKDKATRVVPTRTAEWQAHKLRYQSKALPCLSYLYHVTHKGGEKGNIRIRRTWLNMMDAQALAIWWCDDGSLVNNTKQGVFCTDGFTLQDIKILDRYMKIVWNVNTAIFPVGKTRKDGSQRYRLWIRSVTELKKLLRIIMPYIPVYSMLYKVLILYKDSELQQRWISEMVEATSFSREEIESLVQSRKSELKAFQRMI